MEVTELYTVFTFASIFSFLIAYENIALRKKTILSSRLTDSDCPDCYGSERAVDGILDQRYDKCTHTALGQTEAYWQVDLGGVYNIHDITIYYRKKRLDRLHGYSVLYSLHGEDQHLLYKDNIKRNPYSSANSVVTHPCQIEARYIKVYNKRNDSKLFTEKEAFMELCEVLIYGCPQRKYGPYCNATCGRCKDNKTCSGLNGSCGAVGCGAGWTGEKCSTECQGSYGYNCNETCSKNCLNDDCDGQSGECKNCRPGYYGPRCQLNCGKCLGNKTCDQKNGKCQSCEKGYTGEQCMTECPLKLFGYNCSKTCKETCVKDKTCDPVSGPCSNRTCDSVSGKCHKCQSGWIGEFCDNECKMGTYGPGCNESCGNCLGSKKCNVTNGECLKGCEKGFNPPLCKEMCYIGRYGENCMQNCSGNCQGNVTCDRVNGHCQYGCIEGWNGQLCDKVCDAGYYGRGCVHRCSPFCKDGLCDRKLGDCHSGCIWGWKGSRCDQECELGTYGKNCDSKCYPNCQNKTCHAKTGRCTVGCLPGFTGDFCNLSCDKGKYGFECENQCGFCIRSCDHKNGKCIFHEPLCQPGYLGEKCQTACNAGRYGQNCMQICSSNCHGNVTCDRVNGHCKYGCIEGRKGLLCDQECENGNYGFNCEKQCGFCTKTCDHVSGRCKDHKPLCMPGYIGQRCQKMCPKGRYGTDCINNCSLECYSGLCSHTDGACLGMSSYVRKVLPVVSGIIASGLAFVLLTALISFKMRRSFYRDRKGIAEETATTVVLRRADMYVKANRTSRKSLADDTHFTDIVDVNLSIFDMEEVDFTNIDIYQDSMFVASDISVKDLPAVIAAKQDEKDALFKEEFLALPYGSFKDCCTGKKEYNAAKNRFVSICPYDHSRVKIEKTTKEDDYINASHIQDAKGKFAYIAAQGPKSNTVTDHWLMIWQQEVNTIVMMSKVKEGDKKFCHRYWPKVSKSLDVYPLQVTTTDIKTYYCFKRIRLLLQNKKTMTTRTVMLFEFTNWSEDDLPDANDLVFFHLHVDKLRKTYDTTGLLLVHCGCGTGRTGVYIALDALYNCGKDRGVINVAEYIKIMRRNRMNMVKSPKQYILLHLALLEGLTYCNRTIKRQQVATHFQEIFSRCDGCAKPRPFQTDFEKMQSRKRIYSNDDYSKALNNMFQNTNIMVLPLDKYRLGISSHGSVEDKYVNAIKLPSHTTKIGFIISQFPASQNEQDLIKLMLERDSKVLVSIGQLSLYQSVQQWFEENLGTDEIKVSFVQEKENLQIFQISFKMAETDKQYDIKVYEMRSWPRNVNLLFETESILRVIKDTIGKGNDPITVMSEDGASGCDVFCVLYCCIQQLLIDGDVDVYNTIRRLQVFRPEFISSLGAYQYCCKAITDYI